MLKSLAAVAVLINLNAFGQEDVQADQIPRPDERAQFIVENFFYFLNEGDTTNMKKICSEEIVLQTTYTGSNGKPILITEDFNDFLKILGEPRVFEWEERISDLEIKVDDNLAHAWMNYQFYVNDKFSHCGVNSFHLVKTDDGWQILSIIDTRRKDSCN